MIIDINCDKGGVGKSTIARVIVHHFIQAGEEPVLIDIDTGNPDLARSYMNPDGTGKRCTVYAFDADTIRGWERMQETMLEATTPVIINSGARNGASIRKFGPALDAMCRDLGTDFVTVWPIDADLMCLEQLSGYLETINHRTVIIKNLHMATDGSAEDFAFLEKTKIGRAIPSVFFPALTPAVMEAMKTPNCRAIHELEQCLTTVQRYMSRKCLAEAEKAVAEALSIAKPYEQQ